MIVRPKRNWFSMLFVWSGSVLQTIIPQLLFLALVSGFAVLTQGRILGEKIPLNTAPFTLFGVALTIFLAFRNNASYERFKEARYLWGHVLIASRSLTSQILCYLPEDRSEDRIQLVNHLIAFAYSLKHELRKTDPTQDLVRLVGRDAMEALRSKHYRPTAILNEVRHRLSRLQFRAVISENKLWMLDAQINELATTVGGCERIASTPIPFSYGVLLHRTVYAYCIMLPFGLVDSTELFTPIICVFVAYTLIALEAIADEVSEPFSEAPNALALDAIARNIERSLLELSNREIPEEKLPDRQYQLT
ncbi:bestrophin family protein [Cupriavidus necator]|uniref:bestrophin family protein n=1 Tax=Cupriavidus necator TaxID=106590 RepID=UPI00059B7468|nr:bestrophin family ion channel [Cupriavidus necator]MDX6010479.1 bestrophin family ion channel [Cupriavidus necator]